MDNSQRRYEGLIAAIFVQAVKDRENPQHQEDVRAFVSSTWFTTLAEAVADAAHTNPATMRSKFQSGAFNPTSIRAPYR